MNSTHTHTHTRMGGWICHLRLINWKSSSITRPPLSLFALWRDNEVSNNLFFVFNGHFKARVYELVSIEETQLFKLEDTH